jgi:type I restriction enzyme S subunit
MVNSAQRLQIVLLKPDFLQADGLKCVSVKFNEIIERDKRLDASYFGIESKKARQIIADCPYPKLPLFGKTGFAQKVYHFPPFRRIFVKKGIPIFTASQMLDSNPIPEKFISSRTKADLEGLTLKEGQIVVTCSGSIGFCSIVTETLKNKVFSHDLIRIECNNSDDIGYIYAFLKTKIGHKIVTTNNYGSVVTHIEPEHLTNVLIPDLPDKIKEEAHKNIMQAFKLRDEANELLKQADELLFKRLNLPPMETLKPRYIAGIDDSRVFSIKVSDWRYRIDGSFHLPIVCEIVKQLKKSPAELTTIGDKRVSKGVILPGRFKRIYVTEEYGAPFLSGGDILQFDPVSVKYLSKSKHNKRVYEELMIYENMILVTRSGTVGNVLLSPKHFEDWAATEHIIRIIPAEDINAGYIYAFLASSYGKMLIKRFTYGSVVDEIDDKQLASVEFPLPSKTVQDEIGNLILDANKKRTQAYNLEKTAINKVEEIITSDSVTERA